jgi:hypothetical protein
MSHGINDLVMVSGPAEFLQHNGDYGTDRDAKQEKDVVAQSAFVFLLLYELCKVFGCRYTSEPDAVCSYPIKPTV